MRLELEGIRFGYNSVDILQDVCLTVEKGQVLSLVGPNGSGKTTLLKCINKILKPKRGTLLLEENDIARMGLKELAREIGYVPQSAPVTLPLTVFDTVLLGRKPYVNWRTGERDKEITFRMIELMELEHLAFRMFNELSGGEKQRVLMARAFAQEPQVLLLDEPTSNLDLRHQFDVLDLVIDMVKERELSAVMAIHDLNLASRFSDRIVMLKDGEIYAVGTSKKVLNAENIRVVYGVEAVIHKDSGRPYIIPLGSVKRDKITQSR
ncbi:MAG: ABC transporter ATP-binding protein [Chloroflexota bacterium]|nr:ABC transporter ATP-binding protein [Chloroflexota bacterium]